MLNTLGSRYDSKQQLWLGSMVVLGIFSSSRSASSSSTPSACCLTGSINAKGKGALTRMNTQNTQTKMKSSKEKPTNLRFLDAKLWKNGNCGKPPK